MSRSTLIPVGLNKIKLLSELAQTLTHRKLWILLVKHLAGLLEQSFLIHFFKNQIAGSWH